MNNLFQNYYIEIILTIYSLLFYDFIAILYTDIGSNVDLTIIRWWIYD